MGYSRDDRKVFGYIEFRDYSKTFAFENSNHYVTNAYYLSVGGDKFHGTFSG